MHADPTSGPAAMVERLRLATNAHDLDALVACFAAGLPQRDAGASGARLHRTGPGRRNWSRSSPPSRTHRRGPALRRRRGHGLDGVGAPGTRPDGSPHLMRGVVIFGVRGRRRRVGPLLPRAGPGRWRRTPTRRYAASSQPGGAAMILVAGGTGRLGTRPGGPAGRPGAGRPGADPRPARAADLAALGIEVVVGDVRDRASLAAAVRGARRRRLGGPRIHRARRRVPGHDRPPGQRQPDRCRHEPRALEFVLMSVVGAAADSPMELFRMKHAAEQHLLAGGAAWTIVRATAFLELWIDVLGKTAPRSGRPVVFGRGDNPINFVSVTDVAGLVDLAVTDPAPAAASSRSAGPTTSRSTSSPPRSSKPPGGPARRVTCRRRAAAHGPLRRVPQARARPPGACGARHGPGRLQLRPDRHPGCLPRHFLHAAQHVPPAVGCGGFAVLKASPSIS